ncbi:hypothetical protein Golob_014878 [Gossypium lobatum]|nr:hypothetical protein [Gossypium lobatum]
MQCTPDMDQQNCSTCLNFAINEYQSCCSTRLGCRVLRPNCVLRFETNQFYNQTAIPLPSPPPSPTTSPSPTASFSPTSPPTSMASLEFPAFGFVFALFLTLSSMLLLN